MNINGELVSQYLQLKPAMLAKDNKQQQQQAKQNKKQVKQQADKFDAKHESFIERRNGGDRRNRKTERGKWLELRSGKDRRYLGLRLCV